MTTRTERILAWAGVLIGSLYVLNPTFGLLELIPDNAPIIGNLDEAGATLLVVQCIRTLRRSRKG